jgi:glycine/sarcosine N-methyltransferase
MYDAFSDDYDRFVNWESRLAFEMPFLDQQLQRTPISEDGTRRVLDAACGTGMHTLALARQGYQAAGADLSGPMIARARANAADAGLDVHFETAGFGELAQVFGKGTFGAVVCLGNSLPHLLTEQDVLTALVDFHASLQPGGLLLVQNRNFDAVMAQRERWMEPQAYQSGEDEWIFIRFYDYEPDGSIRFNILTLKRGGAGSWKQSISSTTLRPQLRTELVSVATKAVFEDVQVFGNMKGEFFDSQTSGNLILVARKHAE